MLIQEPVHAAIWHCLNHYAYADATFLSERLFAEVSSEESLHLLATCYYRSGKISQAYDLLSTHGARTPQNRFLFAKCCLDLNKYHEAQTIFGSDLSLKDGLNSEMMNLLGDSASFSLQLLARIFAFTERPDQAILAERAALKLNPFLWKSFERLCQKGDRPDPSKIFYLQNVDSFIQCNGLNPIVHYANSLFSRGPGLSSTCPTQQAQLAAPLPPPTLHPAATQKSAHFHHPSAVSSTSTPISMAKLPPASVVALQSKKPSDLTPTPPQGGLPIPQLMVSMITPVQNLMDSTFGTDSCFTESPWVNDNYKMVSGIGALNFSSDVDSSMHNRQPPPAPRNKSKKSHMDWSNIPSLNLTNWRCNVSSADTNYTVACGADSTNSIHTPSFGVLPRGTITLSNQGVKLSQEFQSTSVGVGAPQKRRLHCAPFAVLSPCPAEGIVPSVTNSGSQQIATHNPLMNSTNSEVKPSKRGLVETTSIKMNVFTPSSQNHSNNLQNITPGGTSSSTSTTTSAATGSGIIQSVRRSSRLFVSSQQSKSKENSKGTPISVKPTRKATSKNRAVVTNAADLAAEKNEKNKEKSEGANFSLDNVHGEQAQQLLCAQAFVIQKHCVEGLLQLLRQLGWAYLEMSSFNCQKAISLFEEIPHHHLKTAWVMGQIGKAYFELAMYKESIKCFQRIRSNHAYCMEFMEYYSTSLWHLQEEFELSALAQELTSLDKFAPQAWCAAGNCFSHQKEHENAIKFFNRAIQVDPNFSYAYTLLGHEYIMIEELDKALACFRTAVRVDPRHYNAWYGIGLAYYRQERFPLAEIYYKKALAINSKSPVLMCHVAVVQHALKRTDKALETLNMAIEASPKNSMCKFEKASILFSCERYQEALVELNQLKEIAPKESTVYFLIGKVHNKLKNTHLALMHFSWAMDLDPKVANSQVKDALDPTLNRAMQDDMGVREDEPANRIVGEDLFMESLPSLLDNQINRRLFDSMPDGGVTLSSTLGQDENPATQSDDSL